MTAKIVRITADQLRSAVSMRQAITELRSGFVDLVNKQFDMPTRTVLQDGQFITMAAAHLPTRSAIVKTLSVNFDRVPAITGTVVWTELDRPDVLVTDAAAVTTLRTGAAIGVATDLLAPPEANTLTIFGAGAQAIDQVRGVHTVRPLTRVTVLDPNPHRVATMLATLAAELPGAELRSSCEVATAVGNTDIICCATPSTEPLFHTDMLAPRTHVNAIGAYRPSMRELPDDLLASSVLVVDDLNAVLAESGEIIHALANTDLSQSSLIELGSALTHPPHDPSKRTVFKTVGVAMQDWVIARLLTANFLP